MGWFKDRFSPEPVECPRGWGQVSFVLTFVLLPFVFALDRRCPIGGVENCKKCRHPVNPGSADLLHQQLVELEGLRGSTLSDEEFRIRRRLIVEARAPHHGLPGDGATTAALVLGPLGVVVTGVGWYLTAAVHAGFLGLLAPGLLVTGLAVGLAGIGRHRRRSLPKPDDRLLEDLHFDRQELEARLGRAQEELGFFRELHGPEPLERPASPDATRLESSGQPEAPDATRSEFSGQPESPDSNDP